MKKLILTLLTLFLSPYLLASELKPFTSDGCSVFPDGTFEQQSLWLSCCIRHDLAYWKGGSYQEKQLADQALQYCVTKIGEPEIANIMLAGVKVGGSAYYPTSYRWGYGWPYLRGYKALNSDEKKQVKDEINKLVLMFNTLLKELDSINQQ